MILLRFGWQFRCPLVGLENERWERVACQLQQWPAGGSEVLMRYCTECHSAEDCLYLQ